MNRRAAGTVFCLIAALLLSAKYIAAAIYLSGSISWDAELFRSGLTYVGGTLTVCALLALIVGVAFLVWEELEARKR